VLTHDRHSLCDQSAANTIHYLIVYTHSNVPPCVLGSVMRSYDRFTTPSSSRAPYIIGASIPPFSRKYPSRAVVRSVPSYSIVTFNSIITYHNLKRGGTRRIIHNLVCAYFKYFEIPGLISTASSHLSYLCDHIRTLGNQCVHGYCTTAQYRRS
jgi:hypothetical protein